MLLDDINVTTPTYMLPFLTWYPIKQSNIKHALDEGEDEDGCRPRNKYFRSLPLNNEYRWFLASLLHGNKLIVFY